MDMKFRQFLLIGGMPEIVNKYTKTNDIQSLSTIYDSLLTSYLDDVEKYTKNQNTTSIITHVIKNSFGYASDRIKFQNFGNSDYHSREVGEVFRTLEKTMLLQLVYPVTSEKIPIHPDLKKTPKLQLLDTGLVNYFAGLQKQVFNSDDISDIYEGKISEHIVGQEILSIKSSPLFKLNFWTKESKSSNAEIDFIIIYDGLLIPIEVKTGASGRLRSLHQFIDISQHPFSVRIYSGKLSIDKEKTINGKSYYLLNLPFYLIGKIDSYLDWFINNNKL
jgi:predicted AAA+ superfamily ATPase